MVYAAPLLFLLPWLSRRVLESAISLAEVKAARGGLDGGDGRLQPSSGAPLCLVREGRVSPGRKVGRAGGVYDVATGEHGRLTADSLAMTITTLIVGFIGSHFFEGLPRLRFLEVSMESVERDRRRMFDVCMV